MIGLLLACVGEPGAGWSAAIPAGSGAGADTAGAGADTADTAGSGALAAPRLLRRISLDLRGVLPTEAELEEAEADPERVMAMAAGWFAAPTADDRLVSLLAERWQTVLDTYEVSHADYGLPPELADAYAHAVGEEPLRLISRVIRDDLPWRTVVEADWTMADDLLAGIWPLAFVEGGGSGWRAARYTDGRPAAGVLATNGMWWRYVTNLSNRNRGRAAAIARLLLCDDLLGRPVEFGRSADPDPEHALRTEPACLACHAAVDPLAAHLFGFWWATQYNTGEMSRYHPERERLGESLLGTGPVWYGQPTAGLSELGWYVAEDPRFERCAVEGMAEQLWRRPVGIADFDAVEGVRRRFAAAGGRPQAMILDLMREAPYLGGEERLLSPNQQRLIYADLAGLSWTEQGYTVLENDAIGVRALGGGVNGYSVTTPQRRPGLTWVMVNRRAAQAAAQALASRPAGEAGGLPLEARPGEAAFTDALDRLHWRLYAERPDAAWRAAIAGLWLDAEDSAGGGAAGARAAWEAVVEAMLRDPRFVSY